jgi:two-component system, cell cycle response regulator CtrA
MRVLLIDQEVSAAQAIKAGLARASVVCDVAEYEAEELVELAASGYDAIVASVPNARLDVAQFISTLRHRRIGLPVVVLQGFRNSAESVQLINAGADDVLAKPVNLTELAARLRGINRRINGHVDTHLAVGRFTYFFDGRMPTIDAKTVKVSRRERELLECLVLRQGRIVSRRFIYSYIYGHNGGPVSEKTVDVVMCKVRKKLRSISGEDYIQTLPGQGYRFVDPDRVRDEGRRVVVAFSADEHEPVAADAVRNAA